MCLCGFRMKLRIMFWVTMKLTLSVLMQLGVKVKLKVTMIMMIIFEGEAKNVTLGESEVSLGVDWD